MCPKGELQRQLPVFQPSLSSCRCDAATKQMIVERGLQTADKRGLLSAAESFLVQLENCCINHPGGGLKPPPYSQQGGKMLG